MKTAKEMFEKLGYEQRVNGFPLMQYYGEFRNGWMAIHFDSLNKEIFFECSCMASVELDELQAINKQVEELGWDNE